MVNLFPKVQDLYNLTDNFTERKLITNDWLTVDQMISILMLKVDNIVPNIEELKKVIEKDNPVIKFWIDPTGLEIHLWHSIPINIARLIQSTGKRITLIIWDFTAKIWDPTGRNTERKILTDDDIKKNYEQYKLQAAKFINLDHTDVVHNTSILSGIWIEELTRFFQKVSMGSLLQREDFKKRLEWWYWLSLAEVFYPLLMALDSIKVNADLEIWGKDQLLNFHITRELMNKLWLRPETFITTPLLPWITWTWEKMSKSLNNYVWLLENSTNVYGKIMSIPDSLLDLYIFNFVDIQQQEKEGFEELIGKNPYEFKKALAYYITSIINWDEEAQKAADEFTRKFSKNTFNEEDFENIDTEKGSLVALLFQHKLFPSKSDARRMIESWAIKMRTASSEFKKINDIDFIIDKEVYLKIGKKKFIKFTI